MEESNRIQFKAWQRPGCCLWEVRGVTNGHVPRALSEPKWTKESLCQKAIDAWQAQFGHLTGHRRANSQRKENG